MATSGPQSERSWEYLVVSPAGVQVVNGLRVRAQILSEHQSAIDELKAAQTDKVQEQELAVSYACMRDSRGVSRQNMVMQGQANGQYVVMQGGPAMVNAKMMNGQNVQGHTVMMNCQSQDMMHGVNGQALPW